MKFKFDIRWITNTIDDEELDPRLLVLLKEIRDRGSLRQAADASGISYRFAWELFRLWHERFSMPLALFERGRGANLTELGEKLLWAEQILSSRLRTELNELGEELNLELSHLLQAESVDKKIRVHASHDLAISHLEQLCHQSKDLDVDFQVRGSLEGLRQLALGQCDIAGFHLPRGELSKSLQSDYRPWLDENKVRLLQIAVRQQGLMTQAGNPRHIGGLKDLCRRSLHFINRQKESGTRIIFDKLLEQSSIDRESIKGYYHEEFTHLAVAAMLASGAAEAAFGIKAAASKFGLHFIPLVEESYVLAIGGNVSDKSFSELQGLLRTDSFKKKIKALPGYTGTNTGKIISIEKLLLGK
ncbi:MAG: helix-turn-helix transcriptional regulator [Gammaproteobacteria bacterium]|jgi:putative molybdopterin biosynthesis protein|nr:helix-turn-helix transcriptional regulator [Gammaproteobacteria bacterium]